MMHRCPWLRRAIAVLLAFRWVPPVPAQGEDAFAAWLRWQREFAFFRADRVR